MVAGLILAGGKNSRMGGRKKLYLEYGGESFLLRARRVLATLPVTLLSVEDRASYGESGLLLIEDETKGLGPLGGLISAFRFGQKHGVEAFLTAASDMPFLTEEAVSALLREYGAAKKAGEPCAVIAKGEERLHPLFGVYPVSLLDAAQEQLRRGDYSLMGFLSRAPFRTVDFEGERRLLKNVNTPEDYAGITGEKAFAGNGGCGPVFFAVSGYKNSGKTTFLTRLIPELLRLGLRVAVIKHDGHDFTPDVPGTDSDRCRRAGAFGTAVFSSERYLLTRTFPGIDEAQLAQSFPDADVILIEGLKDKAYPRVTCRYPQEPLPDAVLTAARIADLCRPKT